MDDDTYTARWATRLYVMLAVHSKERQRDTLAQSATMFAQRMGT
jgi:hypothetical protein